MIRIAGENATRPAIPFLASIEPWATAKALDAALKRIEALEAKVAQLVSANSAKVPSPVPSVSATQEPWVAEGVSRRTWYRRQKESAK